MNPNIANYFLKATHTLHSDSLNFLDVFYKWVVCFACLFLVSREPESVTFRSFFTSQDFHSFLKGQKPYATYFLLTATDYGTESVVRSMIGDLLL